MCLFVCIRGDTECHGGLRTRELGQSPFASFVVNTLSRNFPSGISLRSDIDMQTRDEAMLPEAVS